MNRRDREELRVLGAGLALPIDPGRAQGAWPMVAGARAVEQSLLALLSTQPGERVRRPGYGCGLHDFLFDPNTVATRALMRQRILESIQTYETRLDAVDVAVMADEQIPTLVHIELTYQLVGEPAARHLVYPFYLERDRATGGGV